MKTGSPNYLSQQTIQVFHFVEMGVLATGLCHDLADMLSALTLSIEAISLLPFKPGSSYDQKVRLYTNQALVTVLKMGDFTDAVRKQLKQQTNQKLFSVNRELQQIIALAAVRAKRFNVNLQFEQPSRTQDIRYFADPVKFSQVIYNLLSNAIDAYARQPVEQLAPKKFGPKVVKVRLMEQAACLLICVEDEAGGVAAADQQQLFEPFFTTKFFGHNLGLGLFLAKKTVVDDFHGNLTYQNPSQGKSVFVVTLPILPKPVQPVAAAVTVAPARCQSGSDQSQ